MKPIKIINVLLMLMIFTFSTSVMAKGMCHVKKGFCPSHKGKCSSSKKALKNNIRKTLKKYETALNANNVSGVMQLYTKDGVFMPQHSPSQVGHAAIQAAYQNVFKAIDLNVSFKVKELKIMSYNWAYLRTTSSGSVTINKTGKKVSESNNELFLMQRQSNGEWKIARYIFSTANPRI